MGIPLVALMGRPPQILDYGQQMAQAQQIQGMKNQNALAPGNLQLQQQQIQGQDLALQQQRQQLADQQAATKAMQEWDGKDYGNFASLALKHGASATTVIGMKKALLDQQESALKMTETQRQIEKQNADYFAQGISNIEALPADQQPQAFEELKAQAVQTGRLNPQQAQQYQYKDPQQLEALRKLSIGHAAVMDEANKQASIGKEQAQGELAKAEIPGKIAAGQIQQQEAAMTPEQRAQLKLLGEPTALEMKDWLNKNPGKGPADFLKYKSTLVPAFNFNLQNQGVGGPASDPLVDAVGQNRMKIADALPMRAPVQVRQAFLNKVLAKYPDFNSSTYDVEKGVMKLATSGEIGKNLTAFNTAIDHAGQLSKAVDALGNGDVRGLNAVGNALGYQFGSDKTTNFNVIKNALSGEISKVFKGGQATDAEIKAVEEPFNSANSPAQLKGAIRQAISLMNSKRNALQEQVEKGKKGEVNFGQPIKTYTPPAGAKTATGPNGHKIVVDGGKWVDAETGAPI